MTPKFQKGKYGEIIIPFSDIIKYIKILIKIHIGHIS